MLAEAPAELGGCEGLGAQRSRGTPPRYSRASWVPACGAAPCCPVWVGPTPFGSGVGALRRGVGRVEAGFAGCAGLTDVLMLDINPSAVSVRVADVLGILLCSPASGAGLPTAD